MRVTGFDPADVVSGTDGEGHSTTSTTPVFPATTPDKDSTLVIRGVGADNDVPSATAWVPSGHTKIESANSGGANDCSFVQHHLIPHLRRGFHPVLQHLQTHQLTMIMVQVQLRSMPSP